MNKQLIAAIIFSALISGLLGFYGGRFYERKTFRNSMSQRIPNFRNGNFRPGQRLQRNNPQGQENMVPPIPIEATPSTEIQN